MIEDFDAAPTVAVHPAEYRRMLGFPPGHEVEGRAQDLCDQAANWFAEHGRPWTYLREVRLDLTARSLLLDGTPFHSPKLLRFFRETGAQSALVAAACAGREIVAEAQRHWDASRPDEYFFTEVYGSAVVEHLIAGLNGRICALAEPRNLLALPYYSPGYDGWDIAEQPALFELVRDGAPAAVTGGLSVLSSGMLQPKKAILGVFGLVERTPEALARPELVPCEECSLEHCQFRRVPYRHAGAIAAQVSSELTALPSPSRPQTMPLTLDAEYSVNKRALRKWTRQRLELADAPDGSITARFRLDGSTCSNMGHPLVFDYEVRLSPAADGHRIEEAVCRPADDDTGHREMCAYKKDAEALMERIGEAPPLTGRPLEAVLDWSRESRHSGCYCDAASRLHKWGLALETIHFALAQRESNASLSSPS